MIPVTHMGIYGKYERFLSVDESYSILSLDFYDVDSGEMYNLRPERQFVATHDLVEVKLYD